MTSVLRFLYRMAGPESGKTYMKFIEKERKQRRPNLKRHSHDSGFVPQTRGFRKGGRD